MRRAGIAFAAAALAVGIIAGPQAPAIGAQAKAAPTITAVASSKLPPIGGAVWVHFLDPKKKFSTARISGAVTGAATGNVLKLFGQQFGQSHAKQVGATIALKPTGAPAPYSFTAAPALATSYTVELFAISSDTTPLATSAPVTVYSAATHLFGKFSRCGRPTCHTTTRLRVLVPARALKTEKPKRWFVYFGVKLSPLGDVPPRTLRLGAGHPHVSAPREVNGHEYAVTITVSFFIGNNGWFFLIWPCQRDTEAKDGLGLPGKHGCGTLKSISVNRSYLG